LREYNRTMSLLVYTIQDFERIKANGYMCKLPEQTLKIIRDLSTEVGSPTYVKTPVFKKPTQPTIVQRKNQHSGQSNSVNCSVGQGDMWETLRSFKPTKIEHKTGIDGKIDIIRSILNKLTDKNYEESRRKMMEVMDGIDGSDETEDLLKVGKAIFEIASTNMFYSKLYADMYCDLTCKYIQMKNIFELSFSSFYDVFTSIEYVDPNVDYDLFCKINKINQKRRSLSAFFINLMKTNMIRLTQINQLINNLFQLLDSYTLQENKRNEVDEIAENIAILCFPENDKKRLNESEEITNKVLTLSKVKVNSKEYPSLSSKSIFKFMEIIEKLD